MKYEQLDQLNALREKGAISEDEYQREKEKILNSDYKVGVQKTNSLGIETNSYCMLMHLSQLCGFLFPVAGLVVPIVLWMINKDNNEQIDRHGKIILNWIISSIIYFAVLTVLCFILIGIPLIIAFGIAYIVFIIMAAIKANNGEYYKYPMSIEFVK
jgi:hypothetical protein